MEEWGVRLARRSMFELGVLPDCYSLADWALSCFLTFLSGGMIFWPWQGHLLSGAAYGEMQIPSSHLSS
jgi:hypothetical protein